MSRQITVGGVKIGGGAPVTVQSMTNTKTADVESTVAQIKRLEAAGCEIVRLAVPDMGSAKALTEIKQRASIPIVADIHFDHKLAIASVEAGADKIRINPGNIGSEGKVKEVADCCREHGVPIRIGINSGSLEKKLLESFGGPTPEAMVQSAMSHIELFESFGFYDICVSLKSSSVPMTVNAVKLFSERCDYPIHLGVTETGDPRMGIIKSAAGIGGLLCMGIGDTIRVSLTDDPVQEVEAALDILRAVGMRRDKPDIISCPTCGRTNIDLIGLQREVIKRLEGCKKPITVAVMGCEVNGPGEVRHADVGIAGGDGMGVVFLHGEPVKRVGQEELVDSLMELIVTL